MKRPTERDRVAQHRHLLMFVDVPVSNVARSRAFFEGLGYRVELMGDEDGAAAILLGPGHYGVLVRRHDAGERDGRTEEGGRRVVISLAAASREEVDRLVDAAVAAGGRQVRREEHGAHVYGRSYADLDGHVWELLWRDEDGVGSPRS